MYIISVRQYKKVTYTLQITNISFEFEKFSTTITGVIYVPSLLEEKNVLLRILVGSLLDTFQFIPAI